MENHENHGANANDHGADSHQMGNENHHDLGYDCEFVQPPPDVLQSACPACEKVLKEPCIMSCRCGKKLCRKCIELLQLCKKPCPLCVELDFTFLRDHGLERSLKEYVVWCSHKDSCGWSGKLGELKLHLNRNPSAEDQLNGCQFVEVKCMYGCEEQIQRHCITNHETEQCKKRPYSCDHCNDYDSSFEDVTELYYPQCARYPLDCPNKCREYPFERQELESHLEDQCPLTIIDCPFTYAGCKTQLPRKDMPEHMSETAAHLLLLASIQQQSMNDLLELKEQVQVESPLPSVCVDFNGEETVTDPFFTHKNGYMLCISVYPKGRGPGSGSHVSVYTHLLQGPFDDHLQWPFQGEITIQLLNLAGDNHFEEKIRYTEKAVNDHNNRQTKRKMSTGFGYHKFIAREALLNSEGENKIQFLENSHFLIRVYSVTSK